MWWNEYEYSNSLRCSECLMDRFVLRIFFFFSMRENKREFLGRFIDNNGILFDMQDKICRNVQFYYDSKWYFSFVGISFVSEVTKDGLLSFFTRLPSISFFQRTWKDDYYYYSYEAYTIKNFNKSAIVLGSIQLEAKNFLTIS